MLKAKRIISRWTGSPLYRKLRCAFAKDPDYDWALHLSMLAPLGVLLLILYFTLGLWGDRATEWFATARSAHPLVTGFMAHVSNYPDELMYLLGLTVFLAALIRKDEAGQLFFIRFVVFTLLFAELLPDLLKGIIGAPRPWKEAGIRPFSFAYGFSSFPSGHVTVIVAAALPLGLWLKKYKVHFLAAVLIVLVAFSRLWLGRHHPIDLLGGALVGSLASRYIYCSAERMRHNALASWWEKPA